MPDGPPEPTLSRGSELTSGYVDRGLTCWRRKCDYGTIFRMRTAKLLAGVVVLVFGGLCLNYTTDGKAGHHRELAKENGWPPPSNAIYLLGLVSMAAGAGSVGFVLGSRRSTRP